MEPNWDEIRDRMMALTLKQLKPVLGWFNGSLGGASTKKAKVYIAVGQMMYWWRHVDNRHRAKNVLKTLEEVEFLGR